jgi:enhancing lycopene biosynthesis protein 2
MYIAVHFSLFRYDDRTQSSGRNRLMTRTGKRVGVVLSGCGFLDGTEIHEAILTLLFLDRCGAQVSSLAPNVDQLHVIDHLVGEPVGGERRSVLGEAARIARGRITDLAKVKAESLDALIFPGGFGAAKNLCTFAIHGRSMAVDATVERLVRQMALAHKPQGFICISPVIAAKVLGELHPRLTIGDDPDTATAIESMGGIHVACPVDQMVVDEKNRIVSTPAYMLGPNIAAVAAGIEKLVAAVVEMA